MSEIEIYSDKDNETQIEVRFDNETVWLSQAQINILFGRERSVISKHINNIFKEGELQEEVVCAKFAHTNKHGAIKGKVQENKIKYYNLDVIISVGYRVKSIRGTQFRQWATKRLKKYLVEGFVINQKRLDQLKQTIQLIANTKVIDTIEINEAKGLLDIISNYARSFVLLNQYDSQTIEGANVNDEITYEIKYDEAKIAIAELKKQLIARKEATDLFGKEKDKSFESSLQSIVQTFGGEYLYPSIEEQASNLLYFVIKNHSFNDGNKRIGAFLFIWFLEKNMYRFKKNGEVKINDNGLTAIALLVAQSNPADKDILIKLIVSLLAN